MDTRRTGEERGRERARVNVFRFQSAPACEVHAHPYSLHMTMAAFWTPVFHLSFIVQLTKMKAQYISQYRHHHCFFCFSGSDVHTRWALLFHVSCCNWTSADTMHTPINLIMQNYNGFRYWRHTLVKIDLMTVYLCECNSDECSRLHRGPGIKSWSVIKNLSLIIHRRTVDKSEHARTHTSLCSSTCVDF